MLHRTGKFQKLTKTIFILIMIVLCGLPLFYFGIYRSADYFICRGLVSAKLGMGFSPFSIERYIKNSLIPGMSRDEVLSTLKTMGKIEVIPLQGGGSDISSDQINLRFCSHPLNVITLFINFSRNYELVSIKILGD